jgi:hypothetical protein
VAKTSYTVSTYPRDHLTAKTAAVLDALAANPVTANIGVKSGYRDPAKNTKAGGAKKSQHLHGNAVDLATADLPDSVKKAALDTAIAAGAKGIGVYPSGNLHVDPRATPTVWGRLKDQYAGLTSKQFNLLPDWARPSIDALFGGFNPQQNPNLPETMQAPQFREQAMAPRPAAMPGGLAAYAPPASLAKAAGTPLSLNSMVAGRPEYPGAMPAAPAPSVPRGAVYAGIGAMDRALPSLGSIASSYIGGTPSRPSIGPARENPPSMSRTTVATRPDVPVGRLPAAPSMRQPAGTPTGGYQPSLAHPVSRPTAPRSAVDAVIDGPLGLGAGANALSASTARNVAAMPAPAPAAPTAAQKLAAQYAQYQPSLQVTPTAPPAALPPAAVPQTVITPPPQTVIQDYVPRPPPQDYPVYQAPPAPPRATAYDVYNGMADTALDNTGLNTVSSMPGGGTSVTNQYGATTGMKNGYQTAVGSLPGISLPGISGPTARTAGKLGIPAVGGLLGGLPGALIGALAVKALSKPGGLLSGLKNVDTSNIGSISLDGQTFTYGPTTAFAKPQSGGAFPSAPSAPSGQRNVRGWDSAADRARGESISPGASRAIGRNQGGLY